MAKPISEQALEDVVVAELVAAGYTQRQTSAIAITTRTRKRGTIVWPSMGCALSLAYAFGFGRMG